ncbi:MAG: O-antigen ligase family protein [Clostridia bacterium]|nr:O-antigen ligase family protein [Clostridia bacterium]
MQNTKRGVKARRLMAEKENISNIAKWILVAFCLQFIFYLFLINIVPLVNESTGEINGLYSEIWYNYKGSQGDVHTEGNGIKFIYIYNMILLGCAVALMFYYFMVFLDENEGHAIEAIEKYFKENIGMLFLVSFMAWVFISSCFAYDPFRSFIGCYNLRDGFFSFMFYGSVLICILLMSLTKYEGKIRKLFNEIEIDPRRLIVDIFVVVMTIVAVITIGDYYELNYGETQGMVIQYADGRTEGQGIGISVEPKYTMGMKDASGEIVKALVPRSSGATITSSVFNNSNHYAYVLSIAVVVAAAMLIKAKGPIKIWYALSFAILTIMLILNDTFGAYLGVMISFALLFIHTLITRRDVICTITAMVIFATASYLIVNTNDEKIVPKNFAYIKQSIEDILKANTSEESDSNIVPNSETTSGNVSGNISGNIEKSENSSDIDAGDAGSGRWKLWVGAIDIITKDVKTFIFGAGLENMIYEYNAIDISEGRSHNLILQLAGTVGVPGMVLYVLGVTFIFFKGLKYFKEWDMYTYMGMFVMVSYLITALTGNSGFYTSGYFYIFVGFVVAGTITLSRKREEEKNLENPIQVKKTKGMQ